jgi:hypothetical protein
MRTSLPYATLFFAAATLAGCVQPTGRQVLAVREATSERTMLEGRPLTVSGFLRFTAHQRSLWQNGETFKELPGEGLETTALDPDADCLAVFDESPLVSTLTRYDRQYVQLTGRLVHRPLKADEIDLFRCSRWGISVEKVQPLAA